MYMEDLDLNYRLARAGWVTWYEPSATVFHLQAGTSGRCATSASTAPLRDVPLPQALRARAQPTLNAAVYAGIALKFAGSALAAPLAGG